MHFIIGVLAFGTYEDSAFSNAVETMAVLSECMIPGSEKSGGHHRHFDYCVCFDGESTTVKNGHVKKEAYPEYPKMISCEEIEAMTFKRLSTGWEIEILTKEFLDTKPKKLSIHEFYGPGLEEISSEKKLLKILQKPNYKRAYIVFADAHI